MNITISNTLPAILATVSAMMITSPLLAQSGGLPALDEITAQVQLDTAVPIRMTDRGCPILNRHSYSRSGDIRTYTLFHGDVGGCPNDNEARHDAPYWERALSYSVDYPKNGQTYRFSALIHFDPNFETSEQTKFFQIHQYNEPVCRCAPALMMSMNANGRIQAQVIAYNDYHDWIPIWGWTRENFEHQWVEVAVDITTNDGMGYLAIYIGGDRVWHGAVRIFENGIIRHNAGLYRPGNIEETLPTDRVHVRNMRVAEIEE